MRGGRGSLVRLALRRYGIQLGAVGASLAVCGVLLAVMPYATVGNAEDFDEGDAADPAALLRSNGVEGDGPSKPAEGSAADKLADLPEDPSEWDVLMIGDSVAHSAEQDFSEAFPKGYIDALSNRTIEEGAAVLEEWVDEGWSGDAVIVALGANTLGTAQELRNQFDVLLESVPEGTPIFLLSIRTAGIENYPHNGIVQAIVDERDDVYLIDWYGLSASHPDWFVEDGTHLEFPNGTSGYMDVLVESLATIRAEVAGKEADLDDLRWFKGVEGSSDASSDGGTGDGYADDVPDDAYPDGGSLGDAGYDSGYYEDEAWTYVDPDAAGEAY